jgi:hypothetical protein
VPSALSWQDAFVAVTVAMGDSVEDARASLGHEGAAVASALARSLSQEDRKLRLSMLATALAAITADVEDARLA